MNRSEEFDESLLILNRTHDTVSGPLTSKKRPERYLWIYPYPQKYIETLERFRTASEHSTWRNLSSEIIMRG